MGEEFLDRQGQWFFELADPNYLFSVRYQTL